MAASMVQSVIEILDSAHTYRYELAEVLDGIKSLQDQINVSSDAALKQVETHFTKLKTAVIKSLDSRLSQLQHEIENIRKTALKPLDECKNLVDDGLTSAAQVMEEGGSILKNDPDKNLEAILNFKDDPKTKSLGSLPAIPESAEVACVNVSLTPDLRQQLEDAISMEGKVLAQAPVQIADVTEKPGSLLVQWGEENDEESEVCEFWLQYAKGSHKELNPTNAVFHTAYVGTSTSYLVKHLRIQTAYTFRVCGRGESDTPWSAWSVPRVSATSVEHYQWAEPRDETYSLSNENKTVTRTNEGLTHIIYSHKASLALGNTLTMKVLDDADKSPGDGLFLATTNDAADDFINGNAIYVNLYGSVFVNGQEMTMQLPDIKRGSVVAFELEAVSSSKVRVNIQTEDKEVTFDWKIEPNSPAAVVDQGMFGLAGGLDRSKGQEDRAFYFGVRFSQEDWKVAVD
ncbi:cytokine receptor-like factor 3 [Elysia marginata]|uniref:Cytokine receptor-like factor 3 n=1 Tax=Elysia marginata TaxID=1093978 RepID=A0AAV4HDS3_9GAST|nr:cytokine receptor-like factor 3 [Elysia marginata]